MVASPDQLFREWRGYITAVQKDIDTSFRRQRRCRSVSVVDGPLQSRNRGGLPENAHCVYLDLQQRTIGAAGDGEDGQLTVIAEPAVVLVGRDTRAAASARWTADLARQQTQNRTPPRMGAARTGGRIVARGCADKRQAM
jgi:hypothetical protein